MQERLARLREAVKRAQEEMIEAEAELADLVAEVQLVEDEIEAQIGPLLDQLADLEAEVQRYNDRLKRMRNKTQIGAEYLSVDDQYRRTWFTQDEGRPQPLESAAEEEPVSERQIKKLYRRLARRYHPDLAQDDRDRAYRTEMMTAVNDAYAARSLAELIALSEKEDVVSVGRTADPQTEAEMVRALEQELARIKRRLIEIDRQMNTLHNRASIQLSLEAKIAEKHGRDLLAEMQQELEAKIARKEAERDFLKVQFDQLGPEARIRPD